MEREEVTEEDIKREKDSESAIILKNVNLGWTQNETCLFNLNLEIKKSKLIAIVGKVGCGKSSLLSGILGEMHKLNDGLMVLNGSTAYVPQQAWIQNETAKGNVLFGKEYNDKVYSKVINACSLAVDFQIMPAGDDTEIGEKGNYF
jgi:ABC-type transport system involved in cytochrome bd biosynthesis fused ATPase/permease subunit